uniref:Uncharacterized protein n=1 Tax=Haemonchus contortus TaxID=6289 RepID=A0A7I4YM55_HAECO
MEKMVLGKFSVLASAERNPKFRAKATNEDHGRSKTKITMPLVTLKNMGGGRGGLGTSYDIVMTVGPRQTNRGTAASLVGQILHESSERKECFARRPSSEDDLQDLARGRDE